MMNNDNNAMPEGAKFSFISPQMVEKYSGIELLKMMIAGELAGPPIARLMNFHLSKVEPGIALFRGTPSLEHYNPAGTVHGGWAATVMDSALGCAVQSMCPKGVIYTTVELKVNLVRPLFDNSGEVECEGRIVHFGRTIATSEAKLTRADGKLVAHGSTTCAVMKMPG
jgi:uncharacterized protein (TIGR00369 family)